MRSNTTSVKSEAKTVGLVASNLSTEHPVDPGDRVARTYGCKISQVGQKQSKLKIHPCDACDYVISPVYKKFFNDPSLWKVLAIDLESDVCNPYRH